jgi:hypothetical protein
VPWTMDLGPWTVDLLASPHAQDSQILPHGYETRTGTGAVPNHRVGLRGLTIIAAGAQLLQQP